MTAKRKQIILTVVSLVVMALLAGSAFWLLLLTWRRFVNLNAELAAGLVTAASTILVATLTISWGRYFERKKEIEAHFREKKTVIYDAFLKEFFKVFHNPTDEVIDIVPFLREWQRDMILWGGAPVLSSFLKWRAQLGKGIPDAPSMFLMDQFFRDIRKDLGLSNRGLERGAFIRLMLKNADLFFLMAKENPNVTLEEMVKREQELGLPQ